MLYICISLVIIGICFGYILTIKGENQLIILRGLPNSDRQKYVNKLLNKNSNNLIVSYDKYFEDNNISSYNLLHINSAHTYCLNKILENMINKRNKIIFDNVNISYNEIREYLLLSKISNYTPIIVSFESNDNINKDIPKEINNKMSRLWENNEIINKKILEELKYKQIFIDYSQIDK